MNSKKIFTLPNIYIVLWCIYALQVLIFGKDGTIYSRLIILFLLSVSLYYAVYTVINRNLNPYIKALTALLLMFTIYGLIFILSGKSIYIHSNRINNYSYLQNIYISLLPVYPFYVFTRMGLFDRVKVKKWTVFFIVVATIQFFQGRLRAQMTFGTDEVTNNMGYLVLSLIPLLAFYSQKRTLQYIGIAYIMLLIFLSMKRGAILIGAVSIALFLYMSMKTTRKSRKATIVILGVAIVLVGYYYWQYMMSNSEYSANRNSY